MCSSYAYHLYQLPTQRIHLRMIIEEISLCLFELCVPVKDPEEGPLRFSYRVPAIPT